MKSAFRYRLNDTLLSFLPKFLSSLQEIFDFRVFKMQNLKKKWNHISGYWDWFSVLTRKWCRSQVPDFKCNCQVFLHTTCFSFLWIKHQFKKTVDGITWRKQELKRESNHKKRHGMFTSSHVAIIPLATTILFENWQHQFLSIHVEVKIICLVAGRARAHPPFALFAQHFCGCRKLSKALKQNSSFLQQWKDTYIAFVTLPTQEGPDREPKINFKLNKGGGNTMDVQRGQNSEWKTLQVLCWMTLQMGISLNRSKDFNTPFLSAMRCVDWVCHEYHTLSFLPSRKKNPVSNKFSFPHRSQTDGND